MKHGPIALIDEEMPVVVVAPKHGMYDKIVSNIQEVKSRKGKIISVVTEGDTVVREMSDYYFTISDWYAQSQEMPVFYTEYTLVKIIHRTRQIESDLTTQFDIRQNTRG